MSGLALIYAPTTAVVQGGMKLLTLTVSAVAVSAVAVFLGGGAVTASAQGGSAGPSPAGKSSPSIPVEKAWPYAGYEVSSSQNPPLQVEAEFKVPEVSCKDKPDNSWASFWVGLRDPKNIEQVGVDITCDIPGQTLPAYQAWWEMYPAHTHYELFIHSGDTVEVSALDMGPQPDGNVVYQLNFNDLTDPDKWFSEDEVCNTCRDDFADVVAEGYNTKSFNGPIDFGRVDFTGVGIINAKGTLGTLTNPAWSVAALEDYHSGITDMVPSALSDDGSAFSVKWLSDR